MISFILAAVATLGKNVMKKSMLVGGLLVACLVAGAAERRITVEEYRDKMKAAWVGQMVGVAWATPTEFKFVDVIIPEDKVPKWSGDLLHTRSDGHAAAYFTKDINKLFDVGLSARW